jgi:hypothetical protein
MIGLMNGLNELKNMNKESVVAYSRQYPVICPVSLRKTTEASFRIARLQAEI